MYIKAIIVSIVLIVVYVIYDRQRTKIKADALSNQDTMKSYEERLNGLAERLRTLRSRVSDLELYIDIVVSYLPDDTRNKISEEYRRAIDERDKEPVFYGQSHDPND